MVITERDRKIDLTPEGRGSKLMINGHTAEHSLRYQQSVSDPLGVAPDYARCAAIVWKKDNRSHKQCRKGRGHGPELAYCLGHWRERQNDE